MSKKKYIKLNINTFGAGNFIHKDNKIIHYHDGDLYVASVAFVFRNKVYIKVKSSKNRSPFIRFKSKISKKRVPLWNSDDYNHRKVIASLMRRTEKWTKL